MVKRRNMVKRRKMVKRRESSAKCDPSIPIRPISTRDLLIQYFTILPGDLIYQYAREWNAKCKRTCLIEKGIDEWVYAPLQTNHLIFFTQINDPNIYQLNLFQSNSQPTLFFHEEMLKCHSQTNRELVDIWNHNRFSPSHLMMLYPSHDLIQWSAKYILEFNDCNGLNKSATILTLDPVTIAHCFPLLNNQYVVCSDSGHIFVYGPSNSPIAQWFASSTSVIITGCVISERTFAVSYRNYAEIDVWNVVGERLRTIYERSYISCLTCFDGQLVIGSKGGLLGSNGGLKILDLNTNPGKFYSGKFYSFEAVQHIQPMGNNRFACIFTDGSIKMWNGLREVMWMLWDKANPITKCLWLSNEYLVMLRGNEVTLWE